MPNDPSEKNALAGARGGRFFVVERGMFGMLERDAEMPMLSRAQN